MSGSGRSPALLLTEEGRDQFKNSGGSRYIVSVLAENNMEKKEEHLLDIVLHLFKFHDMTDLPITHEEEVCNGTLACNLHCPMPAPSLLTMRIIRWVLFSTVARQLVVPISERARPGHADTSVPTVLAGEQQHA